jgi:hypothetical protein
VVSLGIFSVASDNSMCPGSTQPLKMSTRILLGVRRPVRMADNLPLSSADVTESGSLKLPEPSGPHRPVMGLLYLYMRLLGDLMARRTSELESRNAGSKQSCL